MSEVQVVRASHGEKAETVAAIHQRLKSAKMAIVTEYRGLQCGADDSIAARDSRCLGRVPGDQKHFGAPGA